MGMEHGITVQVNLAKAPQKPNPAESFQVGGKVLGFGTPSFRLSSPRQYTPYILYTLILLFL